MTAERKNPRDEIVAIDAKISLGLAQFLTTIQMVDHPDFDPDNEDHVALMEEFVLLKRELAEKAEPILKLKELMDMFGDLIDEPEA